jgi:hypothetical protein
MVEKRKQSKAQLRNMVQYRSLSDEDFDKMFEEKQSSMVTSEDFEERIQKKIEEFSQDYDIDDLKINDKETLRAFVQAIIALEDYEAFVFDIRTSGEISQANINVVDRVSKIMSDLRKDISRFQEDLNITRKIRKSDKESSVVSYIANLKEQARQYYESKMSYIFCPECNMLLGNLWVLYPEENNKITLKCSRIMNDGSRCGNTVTVTTKELMDRRGTNKPEITPEALL